jgi:tetratricopeptide (TPR) repeat protein
MNDSQALDARRLQEAATLLDQGRDEAARQLLEAIVRENPSNQEARFLLGVGYLRAANFAESDATLRDVLAKSPDHHRAAYYLGLSMERQGRTDEARRMFAAALRMKPDFSEASRKLSAIPHVSAKPEVPAPMAPAPAAPAPSRAAVRAPVGPPARIGRTVVGTARRVRVRSAPYGKSVLSFVVELDGMQGRVPVEMRGRLFGSVDEGDHVEVHGKRRKGTFKPKRFRNLSTGGVVQAKGWSVGYKIALTLVVLLMLAMATALAFALVNSADFFKNSLG